jgi:DNA-binding MarR family transcriptional regulator
MAPSPGTSSTVLLTQLSRRVYRFANEEVLGMRLKAYAALTYLRDKGAIPQQALGEMCHLDPNNLVLVLNDLETAGYVVRRRDPSDRRRHIVEMTPEGVKAIEAAERGMASIEDDVLASLSSEERATLQSLLARALESEDVPAPAPSLAPAPSAA